MMTHLDDYEPEGTLAKGTFFFGALHPFDMDKVTDALGITPTYLWSQKKDWQWGKVGIPHATWGYETSLSAYDTIDTPANEILEVFCPLRDIILNLVHDYNLEVCLDIFIQFPPDHSCCGMVCEITTSTMRRLVDLEASFQITFPFS